MSFVIGTAGHVDHGKTTLVKALTGVDTDRLPEEKERDISIDIGFAELRLPGGQRASIIDVPGHERFIKNMLAGAGGIDLALLVVAADEGVMPQTREHLVILRMLGIRRGVVALTKREMSDAEWLEMVREEVAELVRGTFLEGAPVVAVSAVTGEGLDELVAAIGRVAEGLAGKDEDAPCRLPVDRVFTVAGFGTVVTGTLLAGRIRREDRLQLLPAGREVRVRQIQVHGRVVGEARAGERAALNLVGVDRQDVKRGDVLAAPGYLQPSREVGVRFELVEEAGPVRHRARLRFYAGTSEVMGRLMLLDRAEVRPGEECFALFRSEAPLVVARGDRFISRSYSPLTTIGGGTVVDPILPAGRRKKRDVLARLQALAAGTPEALVLLALAELAGVPATTATLAARTGLSPAATGEALNVLTARDEVRRLGDREAGGSVTEGGGRGEWFIGAGGYRRLERELVSQLADYHRRYPLRRGIPKESARGRLCPAWEGRIFAAFLADLSNRGVVGQEKGYLFLPEHRVKLTPDQEQAQERLVRIFREGGFSPPAPGEALAALSLPEAEREEVWQFLVQEGILIKLAEGVFLHRDVLMQARDRVAEYIRREGRIDVAGCRDLLGTSRKYAVPLLEYFDSVRLTRRVGDYRVLVE